MTEFCIHYNSPSNSLNGENLYMNQSLVTEMGPRMLQEYSKFNLQTASMYKLLAGWDEMMHNLLMIGKEGYIASLHYDEAENFYSQLQGRKRVRLFPPDCWEFLYPYPIAHPRDRQSQVTLPQHPGCSILENPLDRISFPLFPKAAMQEMYVDLEPGEILYIPHYWFHQMEALTDNISLSWWFKHVIRKTVNAAHEDLHKKIIMTAVRRNIEGMMVQLMGGGRQAHLIFLAIAAGIIPLQDYLVSLPEATVMREERLSKLNEASTTKIVASSSSSSSSAVSRHRSQIPAGGHLETGGDDDPCERELSLAVDCHLKLSEDAKVTDIDDIYTLDQITARKFASVISTIDKAVVANILRRTLAMLQTLFSPADAVEFLHSTLSGRFSSDDLQTEI